jgi:putative nucleotidyltransferase with HDIG domain
MATKADAHYIPVDQLCAGVYVHLDMAWVDHGFPFSSFKIKNDKQIAKIKSLGLTKIRIDVERSDYVLQPEQTEEATDISEPQAETLALDAAKSPQEQPVKIESAAEQRVSLNECEKHFAKAASVLKDINANVHLRPQQVFAAATDLVQDILKTILHNKDVAIHLMSDKVGGDEVYYHSLNVTVLAMMLAKELDVPAQDIEQLGVGCLFHDIGKTRIPDRILRAETLTRVESNLLQDHCTFGAEIGAKVGLSRQAMDIILQHHERADGTGYPKKLRGDKISPLAQITAIVNAYDNHCNRVNPADSLAPYEALAHLYANERNWYEAGYLSVFVRCMGVYPPGTLVKLSNDVYGIVVATNFGSPLRPRVLIYDPAIPKYKATVLDLQLEAHKQLSVKQSLRNTDLPHEVYDYLSPRTRMAYFFDLPKRESASS